MKKLLLLFILVCNFAISQETIGLINTTEDAYDGLTLFTPSVGAKAYLIDNCGNVVNSWNFDHANAAVTYILENGSVLRSGVETLEIRDWDDNLIWFCNLQETFGFTQHHDIEPLPNGNILILVREMISEAEQLSLGKNPNLIEGELISEKIIEIMPTGNNGAQIVWEWRFIDHIVQDYDASITDTYGNISSHPERVDFNYDLNGNGNHENWIHANSIDYNADLDQILFSSRHLCEIYIIDHSTTTLEASGHTGGNSNKGGDFLWRWGNPEVYVQGGTASDRKLFFQHDAKWINEGYPNVGKISVFNNGGDGSYTFSSVHILDPTHIDDNNYQLSDGLFMPLDYFYTWNGNMFSVPVNEPNRGGLSVLENGNMLICESNYGRMREITMNGELTWHYVNPVQNNTILEQYEMVQYGANSMFRAEKYPRSFIGFTGKDLSPGAIIEEENANSVACNNTMGLEDNQLLSEISILNPISENTIHFTGELIDYEISIQSVSGQILYEEQHFTGNNLTVANLQSGVYFISIHSSNDNSNKIFKLLKR